MHVAVVQSYPGASHDAQYLWPWLKRNGGFDRVVYAGPRGTWHPPEADLFVTSRDAYVDGDNLPRKLVDSVAHVLDTYKCDVITATEYDVFHCRPFPRVFPPDVMCGIRVGGQIHGCESTFFCHWPTTAKRSVWERWLVAARQLLAQGRIEAGTPDAFLALACEVAGIQPKFDVWHGFSRNTLHGINPNNPKQTDFLPEAREAYRNGCCVFHGTKSAKIYHCTVENTIREITK
jgi:hypothetical protein